MSNVMAAEEADVRRRITERVVVDQIRHHCQGVSAMDLVRILSNDGYDRSEIQKQVRVALEKGLVEVGDSLRLVAK
jgi:hypothetical protein